MSPAARNDEEQPNLKPSFGKYAVVREIGKGGMAQVFEGRHPELGSQVALKVLNPAIAAQPQAVARFLREARAAAQIRHPHIVRVFDIGTEAGVPFMVMEFLAGADLATLLAKRGALPLRSIVDLFLPIISAVATAHEANIIHRDLKPSNLMLVPHSARGPQLCVLDFGISKMPNDDGEGTLTRSEALLGTVQYMAPELTKGAKFATRQSDQYAMGVMLYECATGKRPFVGESPYEVMHAIVTAPLVPPSHLQPALPPEFDGIVLRAMARDPADRFSSMRALGSELLSLGGKATWALWGREFVDAPIEPDPWNPDSSTIVDVHSSRASRESREGVGAIAPQRRFPWLMPSAAGCVVIAALGVGAYNHSSSALATSSMSTRGPEATWAMQMPLPPASALLIMPSPPDRTLPDDGQPTTPSRREPANPSTPGPAESIDVAAPAPNAVRAARPAQTRIRSTGPLSSGQPTGVPPTAFTGEAPVLGQGGNDSRPTLGTNRSPIID